MKWTAWLALAPILAHAGSDLADIGPSPPVELVDQQGRPFSLDGLRGKVVLVSFIYTSCGGTCPLTTAALDRSRRALKDAGLWGSRVEFVSITLDPARDTPEALARYARAYRAEPEAWHFLTGEPGAVGRVVASWDMWARATPSGMIDHPSRIFLLDPSGHRREIYNLETLKPEVVVRDALGLIAEENRSR